MKTLISTIAILFTGFVLNAQSPQYMKAMGKAMGEMQKAESASDLQKVANTFDRISAQAPKEYLPKYYSALNLIHQSFRTKGIADKDAIITEALERVESAQEMSPGNDELEVLNGYALMAKMVADPQTRGQQLSPAIMQSFGKAMGMNPNNPRATAMMARMELGTAQFFGSEPTKACGLAQKSLGQFDAEKPSGFEPSWGKNQAEEILQSCGN